MLAAPAVAVPIANRQSEYGKDTVATSRQSVPQEAGRFVVPSDVTVPVAMSNDLKIPAAVVPAFMMKNRPVVRTNVSVLTTADGNAVSNVIVYVDQEDDTFCTVLSKYAFAAVPDMNRTVEPIAIPFIADVVVIVVVVHPVAVYVLENEWYVPHAPAPNVPANAMEGICIHESFRAMYQ